jgi:streptomycin 6-kinase
MTAARAGRGWHVRATRVVHNDPMESVAVPERLMTSVRALGPAGSRWLEDLPGILASLAADWSIGYGRPLGGGNAAYVIEAVTASGRPVIAKLALPAGVDGFAPFEQELETLRLAGGDPYAELIRHDVSRRSLLLERLGPPLASLGWPRARQLSTVASTVARGWRPVPGGRLPTGAAKAEWLADFVAREWADLGRPCSQAAAETAVSYAAERAASFDPQRAVLIHGDAHARNVLLKPNPAGGSTRFRLIDPEGLLSEPAHDLGVALRDGNEELLAGDTAAAAIERCRQAALLTGVNGEAIWQWAFIERVSSGLFLFRLGHRQEARPFLAVADRLSRTRYSTP